MKRISLALLALLMLIGAGAWLLHRDGSSLPVGLLRLSGYLQADYPRVSAGLGRAAGWLGDASYHTAAKALVTPASWRPEAVFAAAESAHRAFDAIRQVVVTNSGQLRQALRRARPGDHIRLQPGVYLLNRGIRLIHGGSSAHPIVVSGDEGSDGARIELNAVEGFVVASPHWVFENLDVKGVCPSHDLCEHAFHIVGRADDVVIRNNRLHEFNAMIKVNGEKTATGRRWPQRGLIEYNAFYNDSIRDTARPVSFIDIVGGDHWVVRANLIADFSKGRGNRISYGAFMKGGGSNGVFERNLVICRMGINADGDTRVGLSFGGGGSSASVCAGRNDVSGRCRYEHRSGILRNNIVIHCPQDVGIYLNRAKDSHIIHNTLYNTRGIDVRYAGSNATIRNNLLSGRIANRNGANSLAEHNLSGASLSDFRTWFANPDSADLRLLEGSSIVDKGMRLSARQRDFCGHPRRNGVPDLGAIEYGTVAQCSPNRGFHSQTTSDWER